MSCVQFDYNQLSYVFFLQDAQGVPQLDSDDSQAVLPSINVQNQLQPLRNCFLKTVRTRLESLFVLGCFSVLEWWILNDLCGWVPRAYPCTANLYLITVYQIIYKCTNTWYNEIKYLSTPKVETQVAAATVVWALSNASGVPWRG